MFIAVLTLDFYLHGCRSLKDKRQRLKGLADRFGNNRQLAVCESAKADSLVQAQFSFVAVASNKSVVESSLAKVLDHCRSSVDAELMGHHIDWL